MPLQDLTPQLRTRLSRLERLVGLFVAVATLLLLGGLAYYIYETALRKGWFDRKLPYFTFVRSAAGLKVGDPVKLMGFDVGEITRITAQPAEDRYYDVFVAFRVKEPYYGYLWEHSRAKVGASDFLGKRFIEVTKGTNGAPSYLFREIKEVAVGDAESFLGTPSALFVDEIYDDRRTNLLARPFDPLTKEVLDKIIAAASVTTLRLIDTTNETRTPTGIWDYQEARYKPFNRQTYKGYFLVPDESAALTERLEAVVNVVEAALPNLLDLTNRMQRVLDTAAATAEHADQLLASARPVMTNLTQITGNLSDPHGSLGEWLFPTNFSPQLTQTLANANVILTNSDARLTTLALNLDLSLDNLANITSNLHAQVNAHTNLVGELARLLINADDFVQGLKRHWLLRSAFKGKSSVSAKPSDASPAKAAPSRARSPKDSRRE